MKRIRETIGKTLETAGFVTAMFGAAAMDSADMRYPVAIMAIGVIALLIGMHIAPIAVGDCMEDWDEI